MSLAIVAAPLSGQPVYKVVTPDGKIIYSDRPSSQQGNAQQLGPPQPEVPIPGSAANPVAGTPSVGVLPPAISPASPSQAALRGTKEMNDSLACARSNVAALSLLKAAEEVIRSVNNIKASATRGVSSYQNELLERQWNYYKSLGGTAPSPEQVRLPDDPCREVNEKLRRKSAALDLAYKECTAAHPKEVKLSALSRELTRNRAYLSALEKVQAERASNPKANDSRASGEWTAMFNADPLRLRAQLALQFQEYRSTGGSAPRIEEVSEIPDPCAPEVSRPSAPSPITDKRTLILPR